MILKKDRTYGFKEMDLRNNKIAKKIGDLLPQIDPNVEWVDYIPAGCTRRNTPLIAIGLKNSGKVKYVDVSGKSPFKLVNEVLNAMDDYCLDVMFLNQRQTLEIKDDIARLAKDRAKIGEEILEILENGKLSDASCGRIVREAQTIGVLPLFFPEKAEFHEKFAPELLIDFLKSNFSTFMDTQIIYELTEKEKELLPIQNEEEPYDITGYN